MFKSRLPQIAADLDRQVDDLLSDVAEITKLGAQARVPVRTGRLRNAIHVDRYPDGNYMVKAGNYEVFYGHIVEHGGAHSPAQPFLIPALEDAQHALPALIKLALRDL